jgi:hypothetical protein
MMIRFLLAFDLPSFNGRASPAEAAGDYAAQRLSVPLHPTLLRDRRRRVAQAAA